MTKYRGENDPSGYDYQLCTLMFCMQKLRLHEGRLKCYEIGSAVDGYGALNDVVFKADFVNGREVTYAIQVKNSKNIIDSSGLRDDFKSSIYEYLESFLKIKQITSLERIGELIVWTNMKLSGNVLEWFESYQPDSQEMDLLGAGDSNVPYRRYMLAKNKCEELEQAYLQRPHPRTLLVKQFVDSMFNKSVWKVKGVAKDYYRVIAREIIEYNGDKSEFKEAFIIGEGLLEETKSFRECFERAMKERFETKNYGEFSITNLNCDNYKAYFELRTDADFKDVNGTEVEWKWKDVPSEEDIKEFFKRFVFYIEVPNLEKLKRFVAAKLGNYDQWFTLIRNSANGNMVKSGLIEKFSVLLRLRKAMDCGPYLQLQFDDMGELDKKVIAFFSDTKETTLCIKASQNVDCTVSRLIHIIEKELEPSCERYLVFNYKTYNRKYTELEAILNDPKLIEIGVKCLILTCLPSNKMEDIINKFPALKLIIVGSELNCDFDDLFDVGSIDEDNKIKIEDTEIALSSMQCATAFDIFQDDLFRKEYHQIVLELYKAEQYKAVEISLNELEMDRHYMPRIVERIDEYGKPVQCNLLEEKMFHRFIICDEPGMGKSTELIRTAVELRQKHPDYLVVYLECKTVASKWDGSEKCMENIVCDSLTSKTELNSLVVEKMFQKGKIIMLMDGYDEVISKNHSNLEKLLTEFSTNEVYKTIRLYVATRPHYLNRIRNCLTNSVVCHLKPFSESDQEEYLKTFWMINSTKNPEQRLTIENNTKVIINKFRTILEKNHSVIGIPLQTYMIAVLYKNSISDANFEVPEAHELDSIYTEFVKLIFKECVKRNYDMTSAAHETFIENERIAFFQGHIRIAQAIVSGDTSRALELCQKFQHYGIVRLYPSVGFMHQTYLEYFLKAEPEKLQF